MFSDRVRGERRLGARGLGRIEVFEPDAQYLALLERNVGASSSSPKSVRGPAKPSACDQDGRIKFENLRAYPDSDVQRHSAGFAILSDSYAKGPKVGSPRSGIA